MVPYRGWLGGHAAGSSSSSGEHHRMFPGKSLTRKEAAKCASRCRLKDTLVIHPEVAKAPPCLTEGSLGQEYWICLESLSQEHSNEMRSQYSSKCLYPPKALAELVEQRSRPESK